MDIATLLPSPLFAHLAGVVGSDHALLPAADWDGLEEIVRRNPIDIAVIDPCADGPVRTTEVRSLLQRFPTVSMVLYTSLSPTALRATMELARYGAHQALLHRYDDTVAAFRTILERQPGFRLADAFLAEVAAPVRQLPPALAGGVEQLIRYPRLFQTTPDLAAASELSTRQLYRQLRAAGFAVPRTLLVGARLLRAYSFMREPGNRMGDVAVKSGYTPAQLRRATAELFGCTPMRLRRRVAPAVFISMLVARMYPGDLPAKPAGMRRASDARPPARARR